MLELQRYFPALLQGAGITLVLAVLSVVLAVCLGMAGAVAKLYGSRAIVSMAVSVRASSICFCSCTFSARNATTSLRKASASWFKR